MENFLINMAVIKVNWDESQADILENYLPLLGYAIKKCASDTVSIQEIVDKLNEVAEFEIPRGAINVLLKRAAKRKYSYVRKEGDIYKRNAPALAHLNYERIRDRVERGHRSLRQKFKQFCGRTFGETPADTAIDTYFFQMLFDLAPRLTGKLAGYDNGPLANGTKWGEPNQYRVYSFVDFILSNDQEAYQALESFVQGAMLTETFYYSDPREIGRKLRDIKVYFDTQFLLRALGYTEEAFVVPCKELIDMLNVMGTKLHCFRKTFDEIHGILFAAAESRRPVQVLPKRPGDVFDYFIRNGFSRSDIELELAKLEVNLKNINVSVVDPPRYEKALGVDEQKLEQILGEQFRLQREKARIHDIDCLTAVFRLRRGQKQKYLESCKAMFITTNNALARISTLFFNKEYGVSHAPVCMADHVFTTLVWLKAVKKRADLPKERLVANCYAAVTPSERLWGKYIAEAKRLEENGKISVEDFVVLACALEARKRLMSLTEGDPEVFVEGTVPEILERAKDKMILEANKKIEDAQRKIRQLNQSIDSFIETWGRRIYHFVYHSLIIVVFGMLILALILSIPSGLADSSSLIRQPIVRLIAPGAVVVLMLITSANLVFGTTLSMLSKKLAQGTRRHARKILKRRLRSHN